MPLYVRDTSTVPDGSWRYPHPTNGFVTSHSYGLLFGRIEQAYRVNNVAPPTEETIVKWLCDNLYIECREAETNTPLINTWFRQQPPVRPRGCCSGYEMPLPKVT